MTWLAVICFALLCTGGHHALDQFDIVAFHRPHLLWLFLGLPWFYWLFRHRRTTTSLRDRMIVFFRFLIFSIFIWLLAEPQTLRKTDATTYVFAVDFSASIRAGSRLNNQRYLLEKVTEKHAHEGKNDYIGLITFARDSAVELPPQLSFPFENLEWTQQLDESATDIASALSMADAMMPEGMNRRILLVTDGTQTQGDLDTVLRNLKAKGTKVDVLENAYDFEHEIVTEKLMLPPRIKRGESFYATVLVNSTHEAEAQLRLTENGTEIFEQKVKLEPGKNRIDVPVAGRRSGYYEYLATIEALADQTDNKIKSDGWTQNNKALASLHLEGPGRILLVVNPQGQGDDRDWESIHKALDEAAQQSMKASQSFPEVVIARPLGIPQETNAYLPYDATIFVNVPRDQFSPRQLDAVKTAVLDQGMGFLMVGGEKSFGPGGYRQTPIEDILPVSLDVRQIKFLPKAALAIILHTCEFPQGNAWAKLITKEAIKVLNAQDEAGVLAYTMSGQNKWLFPLMPVNRYPQMAQTINSAQIGDMLAFAPTMQLAYDGLSQNDAMVKHLIIISDGDPQPASSTLMQKYVNSGITISTVAVFPHGTSVGEMKRIAKITGGRFYFPNDPKKLPGIFVKEARSLTKNLIVNVDKGFTPKTGFPSSITRHIDGWPKLYGYVRTIPKGGTNQLVMSVPAAVAAVAEGEQATMAEGLPDEPILAIGRAGTGVTAAFTSDLSTNWAREWVSWDRYSAFVRQLVSQVTRRREASNLRMEAYTADDAGVIVVEDFETPELRQENPIEAVVARVSRPDGDETIVLNQVGPRRYEARFPLTGEGYYRITAAVQGESSTQDEARPSPVHGGFFVPYTREYASIRSSPLVLKKIANVTGGRTLTGEEDAKTLYDFERTRIASTRPIFDWLLILLACLFPLDVACRRVQLDLRAMRGSIQKWLFSLFGVRAQTVSAEGKAVPRSAPKQKQAKVRKEKKKTGKKPAKNVTGNLQDDISQRMDIALDKPLSTKSQKSESGTLGMAGSSGKAPADKGQGGSMRDRLLAAKKRAQSQYNEDED